MQSSIGHYGLQTGIKRNFLGILMKDMVKQLTKETSEEGVTRKQSKNNGIGMKNKKLRGEINKILGEMTQNSEGVSPGVTDTNTAGEQTHSGKSNSSGSNCTVRNEDTEVRFKNLSLAETQIVTVMHLGSVGGCGSTVERPLVM